MNDQVKISYSYGRGKYGKNYAYIRPAKDCFNRSRRCETHKIDQLIQKHFPVVNYYLIEQRIIGAKNEEFALKEYWRVCAKENIKKIFPVKLLTEKELQSINR